MSFFSPDGALYRFISRFWDMVKLNLMWLLFSVPIVTMGPATVAAFSVTLKMVDETEGYVAHQFVKEFRKNLKNGIPLGLLFLLCIEVVNIDFQLFQKIPGNPWAPLVFGIVAILCGGIGLLQDYTKKIGAVPYMIAITIFFVYALWFGFQIKKAVKMFW